MTIALFVTVGVQTKIDFGKGGAKKRKRRRGPRPGPHPRTAHRARPQHDARHPVHVTLRAKRGLPSLREQRVFELLNRLVQAPNIVGFQVVHYSIQHDHLHLIVEAEDRRALSRGVRSLEIRFAKRLNARLGRKGPLWGDRYHRHDLRSPREVRNALVYVLLNIKKHAGHRGIVVDELSTADAFDGWAVRPRSPPHTVPPVIRPPMTWLLDKGWKKLGLLRLEESPRVS